MKMANTENVLVVGGSGFIGQHIIKHLLQEKEDLGINEIRSIDKVPYVNKIGHQKSSALVTYIGDICKPETLDQAFDGVGTVFHCAAYISIAYPANYDEFEKVNVNGTTTVVQMCIKYNIKRLIYTSCASICFIPFKGSTFSIIINQTESKIPTPVHDPQKSVMELDKHFFIPGYSSSKLRAENIVINASGTTLDNQIDCLNTVALRPPLTYGEGDNHFMPPVMKYLYQHDMGIPQLAGAGGKQQMVYAGNVAWAHVCAYKTLKLNAKAIAGRPVFVTDDTPVNDITRFLLKIGNTTGFHFAKFRNLPHFVFFLLAFIIEMFIKATSHFSNIRLNYSLRVIASYTGSVIIFNRLRAAIHMDYEPVYNKMQALEATAKWCVKWYEENLPTAKKTT